MGPKRDVWRGQNLEGTHEGDKSQEGHIEGTGFEEGDGGTHEGERTREGQREVGGPRRETQGPWRGPMEEIELGKDTRGDREGHMGRTGPGMDTWRGRMPKGHMEGDRTTRVTWKRQE